MRETPGWVRGATRLRIALKLRSSDERNERIKKEGKIRINVPWPPNISG